MKATEKSSVWANKFEYTYGLYYRYLRLSITVLAFVLPQLKKMCSLATINTHINNILLEKDIILSNTISGWQINTFIYE